MKTFLREYKKLNEAQKEAVDEIQGPVIVVAGPGSGKTQLLSMRVANVLRQTDAGPNNILCLTFTESASTAMRERLVELIGADAHKVAIHTFHSFGVEVINQYPEYFYQGAEFLPTDEVLQTEILNDIFETLDHDNPLSSKYNDQFTELRTVRSTIDQLKKAGLTPDNLEHIIATNEAFIGYCEPLIQQAFDFKRLSKKQLPKLSDLLNTIEFTPSDRPPAPFKPISEIFVAEFEEALQKAEAIDKTTPVTNWKNDWLEKDKDSQYVFRDRKANEKLRAVADVYRRYQAELNDRQRFDFSDMVLEVLRALKTHNELRFNLQERFRYILVDEFQDTNDAQMQLLHLLTDNPVHEGRPDILVVGDDDQAIYKFQGAEVNNILDFHATFREPKTVTLTKNYRSRQDILDVSKTIISQGETRLENRYDEIEKDLEAVNETISKGRIETRTFDSVELEFAWVAEEVQRLIEKEEVPPEDIAILGRKHSFLEELMPHLNALKIPVVYERRANVLKEPHVMQLIAMSRLVRLIATSRYEEANALLSEVLSFPFWGIDALKLWQLSRTAYEERVPWLELMVDHKNERIKNVAEFLIESAKLSDHETMEAMLDRLIGAPIEQLPNDEYHDSASSQSVKSGDGSDAFTSPYRQYYFSSDKFENKRGKYLSFLSTLRTLRSKLKEYKRGERLLLADFIEFIDIHENNDLPLVDESPFAASEQAVHVMTAHKAKGKEFDTVFVLNCQEEVWASNRSGRRMRYPKNLMIAPAGDTYDDQLRLFFVAMTRAKRNLYLTGYTQDARGRDSLIAPFLTANLEFDHQEGTVSEQHAIKTLSDSWQSFHPFPSEHDSEAILQPILEDYQMSVTHFNNFLDVSRGGPKAFLLQNLLRFPQAMPAGAAFGVAMHRALQRMYDVLRSEGGVNIESVQALFSEELKKQRLNETDQEKYLKRGKDALQAYIEQRREDINAEDEIERDFRKQGVVIGDAHLTGKIDKMKKVSEEEYKVYDFKTGNPIPSWNRKSGDKAILAWKYKNQLIFYKLLVENSRDWSKFVVNEGVLEFVEPKEGEIKLVDYKITKDDVERMTKLINAVWQKITNLDLPTIDAYEESYVGIRAFEEDLISD